VATPDPTAFAQAVHLARRDATVARTGGVVRGKAALRAYWVTALDRLPDLHFDVIDVYRGESLVVINYRNHRGDSVNEVLMFDGDLVREGHGSYLNEPLNGPLNEPLN
jgi:hypothetical protein